MLKNELQSILSGKQLLLDDLPISPSNLHGYDEVTYRKGITYKNKKPFCVRCGNSDPEWLASFPCARCGNTEVYCRKCIMMGRVSGCTELIGWSGPPPEILLPDRILEWNGTLSEGQQSASQRVTEAIRENRELLVWAVCGAGKTEILFQGIESALADKKRVCIATPRTDVVIELVPRFKSAFPNIPIAALYGGSEDRHIYAPLTISTTHQLLRFYHAFDTLILDEVDAFPYTVEESLKYAAVQARKLESAMIYLTATPSTKWQRECRSGKRDYVTIPARFHRHPLPVPRFEWCGNWKKLLTKGKMPATVCKWVQQRLEVNKQSLIFFPNIKRMEKAIPILREFNANIESVHAEDPDHKEKVQNMRDNKIRIMLTTTILERGVTFPNIDVAVIGAEEDIFTESTLVQIAGRAGRSANFPTGDVTFFNYGKTESMLRARKQIVMMNQEAVKKGLVDL